MPDSQEYNLRLGTQIYDEGHKVWMNAITTSNRFGPGMDYDKLKTNIVSNYYMPAAAYGWVPAMLACSNYFRDKDPILAIKYLRRYLNANRKS